MSRYSSRVLNTAPSQWMCGMINRVGPAPSSAAGADGGAAAKATNSVRKGISQSRALKEVLLFWGGLRRAGAAAAGTVCGGAGFAGPGAILNIV